MFDWIVFHRPTTQTTRRRSRRRSGSIAAEPVIGLLTNVSWDAQLHYPANAFPNMLEWLVQTCEYFATRPDLQLLDPRAPGRDQRLPAVAPADPRRAAQAHPALAPNIIVVPPESGMSTYALMSLCNAAIIYGTKMGVELTSVGLPVIVAGEAWIRNKGLTHDATLAEEYFRILERLPFAGAAWAGPAGAGAALRLPFLLQPDDSAAVHRAQGGLSDLPAQARRLQQLLPGESDGLDTICDGILGKGPFVLRDKAARTPQLVNS